MKRTRFARSFVRKETFAISLAVLFGLFLVTVIPADLRVAHAAPNSNIPQNPGQPIGGVPIGNPPVNGSTREPLRLRATGRTYIDIEATVPKPAITNVSTVFGGSKLYRQQEAGPFTFLRNLSIGVREQIHDAGLRPGTRYCYRLDTTYNGQTTSDHLCATTEWRVEFSNPVMTPEESQRVLAEFDWRQTATLSDGPVNGPHLYHMNILIDDMMAVTALSDYGVHVQASPIFPQELGRWDDAAAIVTEGGHAIGRWHFAVVPGALFNEIRSETLNLIAKGQPAPFLAFVFRGIPVPAAKAFVTDRHVLSYRYLAEQGFEYSATPSCTVNEEGLRVCTIRQELLGWLLRKGAEFLSDTIDYLVEGIRAELGRWSRRIHGEITLDLRFRLINTDPIFGNRVMHSAWRGKELSLPGARVHVRQGLAAFYSHTDEDGHARLKVAKNSGSQVCVELENEFVKLTEFLREKLICVGNIGSFSHDHSETISVEHPYFNLLAQMTDAAEYVAAVAHHNMEKITVLVGSWADHLSPTGRAFAPCMGRMPNLALGGGGDLLAAVSGVLPGITQTAAVVAEFLYSVDVVLPTSAELSRAVGVHEYGHAVMCSMLAAQDFTTFQVAWTDVIIATADQTASSEAAYIAEAFADFLTSQVAGGTNYFATDNSIASEKVDYCRANIGGCIESGATGSDAFKNQIARLASLLHDAFDGHVPSPDRPNDGAHWNLTGGLLVPATNTVRGADDDAVTLDGSFLRQLFDYWNQRGNTLREASFIGGLEDLLRDLNYPQSAICQLFSLRAASAGCSSNAGSAPVNLSVKPGTKALTPTSAKDSITPGSAARTIKRLP